MSKNRDSDATTLPKEQQNLRVDELNGETTAGYAESTTRINVRYVANKDPLTEELEAILAYGADPEDENIGVAWRAWENVPVPLRLPPTPREMDTVHLALQAAGTRSTITWEGNKVVAQWHNTNPVLRATWIRADHPVRDDFRNAFEKRLASILKLWVGLQYGPQSRSPVAIHRVGLQNRFLHTRQQRKDYGACIGRACHQANHRASRWSMGAIHPIFVFVSRRQHTAP